MKLGTLQQAIIHMNSNMIYFCDSGYCKINLTKGQIHDMMESEYGIRPKKKRIFNKKLKQLMHELVEFAIKGHKERNV